MSFTELEQKAKEYRQAKKYEEALPLYKKLWEETKKEYHGAGFLHCLRKLKLFKEAMILANELNEKIDFNNRNFDWCRIEIVWAYIEGELNKAQVEDLVGILNIAEKIVKLKPEDIALKMVVFKVLKSAKRQKRWDIITQRVVEIHPTAPLRVAKTDTPGKSSGWCDQS